MPDRTEMPAAQESHRNEPPADINRRRHKRYAVSWPGVCSLGGRMSWDVRVIDVSDGGFGLSVELPLDVGTQLKIILEDLGVYCCEIVWKTGQKCGVKLLDEHYCLTGEQVEDLVEALNLPL